MTLHKLIWDRLVHQVGGFGALVETPSIHPSWEPEGERQQSREEGGIREHTGV